MSAADLADQALGTRPLRVLLVTAEGCQYCHAARTLLARLAAEYPLAVEELPADTSEGQALALREGVLFPPGVFVDGAFVQYGRPSERKLRQALSEALARRTAQPADTGARA